MCNTLGLKKKKCLFPVPRPTLIKTADSESFSHLALPQLFPPPFLCFFYLSEQHNFDTYGYAKFMLISYMVFEKYFSIKFTKYPTSHKEIRLILL